MNIKRALGIGLVTYIISFIAGIITATAFGVDFETATEAPRIVWIVGIFLSIIIVSLTSLWYFKKESANIKEGALLGVFYIIVGAVIDTILIVPFILMSDAPQDILAYYTDPFFWLTLGVILVTTSLVGHFKGKK